MCLDNYDRGPGIGLILPWEPLLGTRLQKPEGKSEHSALAEYTTDHGARPGQARPVAVIFTDGYAQKSTSEEAAMLRAVIPDTYAIAINHSYPISRNELETIVGSPDRVFTDSNIGKFHDVLEAIARDCIVD
ncbi:hypothetical protein TELCIR_13318 [Teladorsagia circumcincta]|uniref:VWFA domain-containing protein n=1 Tax=Teladorsagia circumcincta TaxID=45464 RepID=A0A2G9U5Q1_TELCI|nr:hypothetical protein TELCIR_13318 [Teladorsagia circumcincta]